MLRPMQPLNLESLLPYLWISGRSSRQEWWRIHMFCAASMFVFDQMFHARLERAMGGAGDQAQAALWLLLTAALSWISWTSVVRRLHDRGKSGWWSLLYLVPGIGWLWLIIECGFLGRVPAPPTRLAPVHAPQMTSQPVPQVPHPRSRAARTITAPRVGTVQRSEHRPWTANRAMKLAGNVVGLALLALVLYQWFFDVRTVPLVGSALHQPATFEAVK